MRISEKLSLIFFIFFVAIYVGILMINAQLGPNDDFMMLRTLQNGKPFLYYSADFPYFELIKYGRFTPLAAMEYNIFWLFLKSPSPFWYYFYHTLQFIALVLIFLKILQWSIPNKSIRYLIVVLLSLMPGFTFVWFRTQLVERNFIFFLALFLLSFANYVRKKHFVYFILTFIAANLTIYYKETAFILVGAFAFFYLLLSHKQADKKTKILCALIILSSLIYFIIYYLYVMPQGGTFMHGKNSSMPFYITFTKNLINYGFMTDPLMIFILVPLVIWRLYKIFKKQEKSQALYDSMLFASFLFIASYFIYNIYGAYYFIPIYVFALPSIFYFLSQNNYKTSFWKFLITVSLFLFFVNSLPLGLHNLTYNKYIAVDFNKTLDFLTNDIKTKYADSRAAIFLDGLNKGSGNWAYFIVSEFLLHRGLTPKQFDLKAQIEDEKVSKLQPLPIAMPKISLPYTVYQGDGASEIKPGDYLIVSSLNTDFSKKNSGDKDYLKSLEKEYDLAFRTKSSFEFPMLTLKEMTRYLLYNFTPTPYTQEGVGVKFLTMDVRKPNFESPDFYVFIKK